MLLYFGAKCDLFCVFRGGVVHNSKENNKLTFMLFIFIPFCPAYTRNDRTQLESATFFSSLSRLSPHLVRIALKFRCIIWKLKKPKSKERLYCEENNSVLWRSGLLLFKSFSSSTFSIFELVVKQEREGFNPFAFNLRQRRNGAVWIQKKKMKRFVWAFLVSFLIWCQITFDKLFAAFYSFSFLALFTINIMVVLEGKQWMGLTQTKAM